MLADEGPVAAFRASAFLRAGEALRKSERFKLALEYLQRESRRARQLRFDVISVAMIGGQVGELRHLVNAF